jgi:hypothetical protein
LVIELKVFRFRERQPFLKSEFTEFLLGHTLVQGSKF